jgi:hypothetical protein
MLPIKPWERRLARTVHVLLNTAMPAGRESLMPYRS